MKKYGFTLAEVLITLAVIGVVAALTMPALVSNYRKNVVVTRMKKFYSVFSQAFKLLEAQEGDLENIPVPEIDHNSDSLRDWWSTYLAKYVQGEYPDSKNGWFLIKLNDGSGAGIKSYSQMRNGKLGMQVVFCVDYNKCLKDDFNTTATSGGSTDGRNSFTFVINPDGKFTHAAENRTRSELLNDNQYGCSVSTGNHAHRFCSALIMHDGWQISDDYPVKF
ncbi:MAG: type II secretion system GspH family protein [Heliobacteriaceae bacterium]|jgi:prepilin-type N-terminal cleavage/methylation domain-containing protein|nr:type II secretion system GspH family protein [Heliobacteriaceae bacterium]